jgi:hypothetical protein
MSRFTELIAYANRTRRKTHLAATIVEAYELYLRKTFAATYIACPQDISSLDVLHLQLFIGDLRRSIRSGWPKILKCVHDVVDGVRCRKPIGPPLVKNELFEQDLMRKGCGNINWCGLRHYLNVNRNDFEGLKKKLSQIEKPDEETIHRVEAIERLYQSRDSNFERRDCYCLGDALIVHETPPNGYLVSSNRRHMEPLCSFLKRQGVFYSRSS